MSEKYELSIGDGSAHIMCEGDRICDVDDFTVWQVESLITKANQHKTLVAEAEDCKRRIQELEEEKRNLQIKLSEARVCCGCIECLNKKCPNNLWKAI